MTVFIQSVLSQDVDSYEIRNLEVNTKYADFGSSYFGDSVVVYSSSKARPSLRNRKWQTNKQPFLELYKATVDKNADYQDSEPFSKKLNTRYHEAALCFTRDLKTVYFTRNNYYKKKFKKDSAGINHLKLFKAGVGKGGEWINEVELPFNSDNYSVGHPTLNKEENRLYFSSDMPGGLGKTDIWYVDIEDSGYGEPENMSSLNTAEREMFPYFSKDDILYFSSDGRDGEGGLDVYGVKEKELGSGTYYDPIPVGSPINGSKDDFSFIINQEAKTGYFSSNREGGKGDDDIYSFKQLIPLVFECNQIVNGVVKDKNSGELMPNAMVVLYDDQGVAMDSTKVGENANFVFTLECSKKYRVTGNKEGYQEDAKKITTGDEKGLKLELGLNLEKNKAKAPEIESELTINAEGQEIIKINPIYFDLDKSYIRPDAAIELEKVIRIMNKYPTMVVQGTSHTDSRGSDNYNASLSRRRAKSTVDYIKSKGVDPSRISSMGYGETRLVNHCTNGVKCGKGEHQMNRRTEFVVIRR